MKNIILIVALLPLLIASCGGKSGTESTYPIVKGEIANADGENAVLVVFEDQAERIIDSVQILDGKFEIEADTNALREYILIVGQQEMPIILFMDQTTEVVTVKGSLPGIGENYTVEGSQDSKYIRDYLTFLKPFFEDEKLLYMELNQTNPQDTAKVMNLLGKLDSISAIQRDYAIEHIEANPSSPSSWMMLRELIPASGLLNFNKEDISYFELVAKGLREKYPDSEYPALIEKDIESLNAQLNQLNNPQFNAPIGAKEFEYAPEIVMNDRDGNPQALSSLKGKVVLIDFWASWCGPCRQENPNVVKAYEKYKDKGFTVFSVSLDEKKDAWLNAIQADNLAWPNHVSELTGWQTKAVTDYGINGIPATFLIDQEGKVIGRNLRGPQLEQKLQSIFG